MSPHLLCRAAMKRKAIAVKSRFMNAKNGQRASEKKCVSFPTSHAYDVKTRQAVNQSRHVAANCVTLTQLSVLIATYTATTAHQRQMTYTHAQSLSQFPRITVISVSMSRFSFIEHSQSLLNCITNICS